jgi:hypothetical protein
MRVLFWIGNGLDGSWHCVVLRSHSLTASGRDSKPAGRPSEREADGTLLSPAPTERFHLRQELRAGSPGVFRIDWFIDLALI